MLSINKFLLYCLIIFSFISISYADISYNNNIKIKKCIGCHGPNGNRSAFGKTRKINEMSFSEIQKSLKAYKNGTHGGKFKGLMKGQVFDLSNQDIDEIAKFFSSKNSNINKKELKK